jgi:cyclopropane fatty-acyl-phospholipid synthase-like methyltransferase
VGIDLSNQGPDGLPELLRHDRFPLSSKYDPAWIVENEMGPNVLWLTEFLCEAMDLVPGMRVLDLGCGKGLSSIFLAKEFDVQVWATDLWIPATDNLRRIREANLENRVFPLQADARNLPFADEFFDAIVSVDAFESSGPTPSICRPW